MDVLGKPQKLLRVANVLPDKRQKHWYVMRDLKRANARWPAYRQLEAARMEVFTPFTWQFVERQGRMTRVQVPFIRDLLFVHETRQVLDAIVRKTPTLQYRYLKGRGYCEPMIVPAEEMERFVYAVRVSDSCCYYRPDEIPLSMCQRMVRIIGGLLDGYEGLLLPVEGSNKKRLLVQLQGLLSVGVEVHPEFIQIL